MSGDDERFRVPDDLAAARAHWRGVARGRPATAIPPGPGQESVWDYPRPPRLERTDRHVVVGAAADPLAETRRPFRVCETASPPVYYVPAADVAQDRLTRSDTRSFCEWKGVATYWHAGGGIAVAWSYPEPDVGFESLADAFAFFPGRVPCFIDGERVRPQAGDFYGGWITDDVVGPFKGEPGTEDW